MYTVTVKVYGNGKYRANDNAPPHAATFHKSSTISPAAQRRPALQNQLNNFVTQKEREQHVGTSGWSDFPRPRLVQGRYCSFSLIELIIAHVTYWFWEWECPLVQYVHDSRHRRRFPGTSFKVSSEFWRSLKVCCLESSPWWNVWI